MQPDHLPFLPWWSALNAALRRLGLAAAKPTEAHRWYWITNPAVAALWLRNERREQ